MKYRMKILKKVLCLLLSVLLILPLAGCWDYRGLNEMTLVIGMSIDINPDSGNFELTYETVDETVPVKNEGVKTKMVNSAGKTIFDAVRNAKTMLSNKLFFGNMTLVVLSEEIARTEKLSGIIDFFLRDTEIRETMHFIISRKKTAKEILLTKITDNPIISTQVHEIIDKDNSITSSTVNVQLYEMYNILKCDGCNLVLSAFDTKTNDEGEEIAKSNGSAIFKKETLCGYMSPDECKYYLFVTDNVKGGLLPIPTTPGGKDNATLEISKSKTKLSFTNENGKVKFKVAVKVGVYLDEIHDPIDCLDDKAISKLQDIAKEKMEQNISAVIKKVQDQYDSDIFGFGNDIYKKDFKLWNKLKKNWDVMFKTLDVQVECKVEILNTASQKDTTK